MKAPALGQLTAQRSPLPLRHLELALDRIPPSILDPLLSAARQLTSLELSWEPKPIDTSYVDFRAVSLVAEQLRHLALVRPPPAITSSFVAFLEACVSLRSLSLSELMVQEMIALVEHVKAELVLLETIKLTTSVVGQTYKVFCSALGMPALSNLQRWRFTWQEKVKISWAGKKEWLATCSARGIEVRDLHRRFTGELPGHAVRRFGRPADSLSLAPVPVAD